MIFRFHAVATRAMQERAFRWHGGEKGETVLRDLSWDFAEPDHYPELVAKHKPGMLAPKAEKEFHAAVSSGNPAEMLRVAGQQVAYERPAKTIAGLLMLETDLDQGMSLLREAVDAEGDVSDDRFVRKYLREAGLSVMIAAGLIARLPLQDNSIMLLLAELYQARELPDEAISLLSATEQTTHIRLSRAEILYDAERFDDVLATTAQVHNDDDFTALLLAYRGRALVELERFDEAVPVLARVLEYPNRAAQIKAIALVGRGIVHQRRGEFVLAKNDLTQALIEVPEDEEAKQHIQELIHGTGAG